MRANNLAISVPYKGCDMKGKCQGFCVSKMTGYIGNSDINHMIRNFDKVKHFAQMAQISSVLVTGKGEPCLNMEDLETIAKEFRIFPLELQTNGIWLNKQPDCHIIKSLGFDTIAISFNVMRDFYDYKKLIQKIKNTGMTARATLNISHLIPDDITFKELIEIAEDCGLDQFSFRKITAPRFHDIKKSITYNEKIDYKYDKLIEEFFGYHYHNYDNYQEVRKLPYNATIYDINGLAFTYFDYCIQDKNGTDDIRSLIFQEDGHLYTTWNSKASRLF